MIGKKMSVKIRGKTHTAHRNKARWTCRYVLDVGWEYGGFTWGVKPGHHAKLVKNAKRAYVVVEEPDEEGAD